MVSGTCKIDLIVLGYLNDKYPGYLIFVFESTLPSKHSSWEAREHFIKWRNFLGGMSKVFEVSTGITNLEFASDVFDAAFMEIAAKMGSFYSMGKMVSNVILLRDIMVIDYDERDG